MAGVTPKVLVVGLDGATFDVLQPLARIGLLPNVGRLLETGCWGRLRSTIPPFTATAWSTFITGQNPGRHGILSFQRRDRYNYDTRGRGFVDARRFEQTLWQVVSAAGRRVGIVNVPMTYPPQPVNGFLVTGILTPTTASTFTYPPTFRKTLGEDYVIDVDFIRDGDTFRRRGFPEEREMLAFIRQMIHKRRAACERLLRSDQPDFFMVVFTSSDRLSHFFWKQIEMLVAASDTGMESMPPLVWEVAATFRELDAAVGRLIDRTDDATTVVLMSDHGFGPAPTWRLHLNTWLEQMGLLQRRPARGLVDPEYWRVLIGRQRRLKALLRRIMPQSIQDATTERATSMSDDIIAWSETRAYFVPIYFDVCGVDINVEGRMREGIVAMGDEYEALRDRIITEAQKLRNPDDDGAPVVRMACRREELYDGPYVQDFPDVILVLDPRYVGAPSLASSSLIEPHSQPVRSGEHRDDGIFIARGPALRQQTALVGLRLLDVPPTLLYLLDIPVPDTFDGQVMREIFVPGHLSAHPIATQQYIPWNETEDDVGYSPEEQSVLAERLRSLGYLE